MTKLGKGMIWAGLCGIGTYLVGAKLGADQTCKNVGNGLERLFEGDLSAGHGRNEDGSLWFKSGHKEYSKKDGAVLECDPDCCPDIYVTYSKEDADRKYGEHFGY